MVESGDLLRYDVDSVISWSPVNQAAAIVVAITV